VKTVQATVGGGGCTMGPVEVSVCMATERPPHYVNKIQNVQMKGTQNKIIISQRAFFIHI
jgi:glycine cleavage system protein P-like pyridoxal-binding family